MRKTYLSFALIGFTILGLKTYLDLQPIDQLYWAVVQGGTNCRITDRHGYPLALNYESTWNYHEQLRLDQFPAFLIHTLLISEDKNFYDHQGVDWSAKWAAVWQNLKARRVIRGASTLTEQMVHLLTLRPRTFWTKWLELIEAILVEKRLSKNHILEFYLNQAPFAANRHGFAQGAQLYFNRHLATLTTKEILALIMLIKAPSSYDLRKTTKHVEQKIEFFLRKLHQENILSETDLKQIDKQQILLETPQKLTEASHFLTYLKRQSETDLYLHKSALLRTTLDSTLQNYVQKIIDQRIRFLKPRQVHNGAVLVIDHTTGEVLAWVVVGSSLVKGETPSNLIDAVTTLRQPGSTLKPFIYAAALQKGWDTTTLINDVPLTGRVGNGMHKFRNYSNIHYGPVTLRDALANSLNVPAIKTIQFVGVENSLILLKKLGFSHLDRGAGIYEEGLALGNGEVSLLELVRAYAILANKGKSQNLTFFFPFSQREKPQQILPDTVTSVIGDILSDEWARRLEFGVSGVMNLPVQTAIKTGTSTDYRDAWVVGYNHKYVVGVWMGNLDNSPTDGITGSGGPAFVLRSIFSHLNRHQESQGLYLSPDLIQRDVLIKRGENVEPSWQTELFSLKEEPLERDIEAGGEVKLLKPTSSLAIAMDPRIPYLLQKFEFKLSSMGEGDQIDWIVDGKKIHTSQRSTYLWPLEKGKHSLKVNIYKEGRCLHQVSEVQFLVK